MSRRLILGFVLLLSFAIGGYVAVRWATTPTPGFSLENFQRLRPQMSRDAVIELLGTPTESRVGAARNQSDADSWSGSEGSATLFWDENHRLNHGNWWTAGSWSFLPDHDVSAQQTQFERLVAWFGF